MAQKLGFGYNRCSTLLGVSERDEPAGGTNGQVDLYPGAYDEYVWSLQKGMLAERDERRKPERVVEPARSTAPIELPNFKMTKKNLERELRQCDRQIVELDEKLKNYSQRLSELNSQIAEAVRVQDHVKELAEIQSQTEAAEQRWLEINQRKEEVMLALQKLEA